jgi:DNA polymerase-3 subunit delta'
MWDIIGHEQPVAILERALRQGKLSHAYLLAGPEGVGKMALAVRLAQAVNCAGSEPPCGACGQCDRVARGLHPDIQIVRVPAGRGPEGKTWTVVPIERVREVVRDASLKPFEGRHRVYIFDGIEGVSEEGANTLLKTLEEPPDQVLFILLAAEPGRLLPTILSRCQRIELRPVPWPTLSSELQRRHSLDADKATELARVSGGRPGIAIQMATRPEMVQAHDERLQAIEKLVGAGVEERFAYASGLAGQFSRNREGVRRELDLWQAWWRDVLLAGQGLSDSVTHLSRRDAIAATANALTTAQAAAALAAISAAWEHLDRNVSARLALEHMMLAIPRVW